MQLQNLENPQGRELARLPFRMCFSQPACSRQLVLPHCPSVFCCGFCPLQTAAVCCSAIWLQCNHLASYAGKPLLCELPSADAAQAGADIGALEDGCDALIGTAYTFFRGMDTPENDITQLAGYSLQQLAQECDNNPSCLVCIIAGL